MNINIEHYQKQAYELAGRFRDIRFTGQVVFAGIVLLISWSGVKTIQTNYELQKQIATLKQQTTVSALENSNVQLQNQYFKSDAYLELSARRNFGLGKAGETELLVPQSVAYAYAPAVATSSGNESIVQSSAHTSNFQAWINFFLHRQQNSLDSNPKRNTR